MMSVADILRNTDRPLPPIRVEIDSCPVRFETDCVAALRSLDGLLRQTFDGRYYRYTVAPADPAEPMPVLRYLDADRYRTSYDPADDICVFQGPWAEIGGSTLLAMWLHLLSELVRQRRGEYLLHASAVVRDGKAVVLSGQGEAGKTICALDLCVRHGFRLFANNRVKAAVRDDGLRLLRGDAIFRLRHSSLLKYSKPLADRIFPAVAGAEPGWQRKRSVDPGELGVETAAETPRIAAFVLLTLDAESGAGTVEAVSSDSTSHDGFVAMADVSHGLSGLIRGASFLPLVNGKGFREIDVPCLDSPDLMRRRVVFLETLFAAGRVVKIRAPLDRAVDAILRLLQDQH